MQQEGRTDCVEPRNFEKFVAVWDFVPSKKDELALVKGEAVLVVKKYKDGWYRGIRCRGYQVGCFPGNFVAKDSDQTDTIEWQDTQQDPLSSSPTSEVNTLAKLSQERKDLSSEENGMDDHNSMENGQPDADGTRMERHDSLSSNNSGNLSPVPFTSFHGLNMIADAMGQGEESEERKRTKAAMELLTSEVSYFNGLNLLSGHYIRPLRKLRIISREDVEKIFSNAEALEIISKGLVAKLQSRLAHWDVNSTQIGDVLVEVFSNLTWFEPYFKSRKKGNELKSKLEKTNEKFRNFLSKVNCSQTLDSLLLMPIQRVPRYELILKELVKRTSRNHPDYENLKEAQSKAQKAAEALNEHLRQIENETKVVEVIKSFPNDELNLIRRAATISPGRQLFGSVRLRKHDRDHMTTLSKSLKRISLPLMDTIDTSSVSRRGSSATVTHNTLPRSADNSDSDSETESSQSGDILVTSTYIYEGVVERVTKKCSGSSEGGMGHETVERHLFLFNNVLLVALPSESLITGKKTYKLKNHISLAQAWLTSPSAYCNNSPDNMFLLGSPTQIYKFLASSESAKNMWVKKLKTCIDKEKEAFVKSFKGLPVPDAEFLAVSSEVKTDYNKTVDLELNLKQGEEILIIGIKSGGSWLPGLYSTSVFEFELAWWPGLNKGRFGWFPAQCVTGPDVTSLSSANEFHPIPVAVALNGIKKTMMSWTGSQLPAPDIEDMTTLKVFKPDKTFKTCKVEPHYLVSDVLQQYAKHKSFVGGQVDTEAIEMREESLDGSVQRSLDPQEKLQDIFALWGKYQGKMKFVMHNVSEKSRKQSGIERERKPEPPTGLLISFD